MNAIQKDMFFPFGLSEGDSVLQDGDDEVSEALKTKKPLHFYDVQFNILYVSHCFHYTLKKSQIGIYQIFLHYFIISML